MAPDKSLAAEIEAVKAILLKHVKPWEVEGAPCVTGIPEAAAEIAAREGGARKRLADALAAYDAAGRDLTAAEAVYHDVCQRMGDGPDIGEIMDRIGAEEACMRCSMAQGIARADLVSAVRAALAEQEKGDA